MKVLELSILLFSCVVLSLEYCSKDAGGGVCPTGNTCCLLSDRTSGCIPGDLGQSNATCCGDGLTGCGVGYSCESTKKTSWCKAGNSISDPLVQTLPRYRLCRPDMLDQVWHFPVGEGALEHYSSHGDISENNTLSQIENVVIAIHGAGRNADDYFCSTMATVSRQKYHNPEKVLVIAPHFPVETDSVNSSLSLIWKDDGAGGSWRYGGNSISPASVSSFGALDKMVEWIVASAPLLRRLIIVGHSAGGQFSQRWSLLTNTWDNSKFRGVVANPSSYVYLSPLRYQRNSWNIPDVSLCPEYNAWEWGLTQTNTSSLQPVPYVDAVLREHGFDGVKRRFMERSMVYLTGSRDMCTVPTYHRDGWCYSHGLETTCMDMAQGQNRRERNARYFESLMLIGFPREFHKRALVPSVGHDHSLMFNSKEGLDAIYKPNYRKWKIEI